MVDLLPEQDREEINVDGFLEQMNEVIGFDLDKDLLATLGPAWTFHDDPKNGLFGFGFLGVAQVRDGERLKSTVSAILDRLGPQLEREDVKIDRKSGAFETITIQIPQMPIAPALGISDKWLVVGMQPQAIKTFFLRVDKKLPTWKLDKLPEESRKLIPEAFTSLQITNPQGLYTTLLSYAPMGINMFAAEMRNGAWNCQSLWRTFRRRRWSPRRCSPCERVNGGRKGDDDGVARLGPGLPIPMMSGGSGTATTAVAICAVAASGLQRATGEERRAADSVVEQFEADRLGLAQLSRQFPPLSEGRLPGTTTFEPEESLSWLAAVLPYLEQPSFTISWRTTKRGTPRRTRPSKTRSCKRSSTGLLVRGKEGAPTHYVGIAGGG